jgi:SAM-dependent methyltransferase
MISCRCCGGALDGSVLDLGNLPACNAFLKTYAAAETHPLVMTECRQCGLIQLGICPPAKFVVPRVDWISYREPEAHLDDLVTELVPLFPRGASSLGLGPFDQPLIGRLEGAGFCSNFLDLMKNVKIEEGTHPYLETLQARMSSLALAAENGRTFNLVVCRYLLEHCHNPLQALLMLKRLLTPGGKLLIEVPDCEKFLKRVDYSFVWEEHICYFSESTLRQLAPRAGLRIARLIRYEGALEDVLVVMLEDSGTAVSIAPTANPSPVFQVYVDEFPRQREMWHRRLRNLTADGRKIAMLGIGHQAIMFLNAFGLQEYISHVADDQEVKQGYYPPGISVPIISSAALADDPEIGTWLLAASPRAQGDLRSRFAALLDRGIRMYSIFSEGTSTATSRQ